MLLVAMFLLPFFSIGDCEPIALLEEDKMFLDGMVDVDAALVSLDNNYGGAGAFAAALAFEATAVAQPGAVSISNVENLTCNGGKITFDSGIPVIWTVLDNEGTGVVWTNSASAALGANYASPPSAGGDAASVNSDNFVDTEFDTELISNPFSLVGVTRATLEYAVNYQNFAGRDFLDVDITTDGGANWTNLLSWNEDHGNFFSAGGELVTLDISAYSGHPSVQLRWHYYDPNSLDWDWYAQIDDVELNCSSVCTDRPAELVPSCESDSSKKGSAKKSAGEEEDDDDEYLAICVARNPGRSPKGKSGKRKSSFDSKCVKKSKVRGLKPGDEYSKKYTIAQCGCCGEELIESDSAPDFCIETMQV